MTRWWTSKRLVVALLVMLLVASLAANLILYRKPGRPLFGEGDRPLIERTVRLFVLDGITSRADIERETFPIVMRLSDRTCVELRRHDGRGRRAACYNRRGRVTEEIDSVSDP
jgi:hypothetical protein